MGWGGDRLWKETGVLAGFVGLPCLEERPPMIKGGFGGDLGQAMDGGGGLKGSQQQ